jgi:hypothetical protein
VAPPSPLVKIAPPLPTATHVLPLGQATPFSCAVLPERIVRQPPRPEARIRPGVTPSAQTASSKIAGTARQSKFHEMWRSQRVNLASTPMRCIRDSPFAMRESLPLSS